MPQSQCFFPLSEKMKAANCIKMQQHIITKITATKEQKISFADFMESALYLPNIGYYNSKNNPFGEKGDFITAPEISTLFGSSIAVQINQLLAKYPTWNIAEFGPGTGKLTSQLCQSLQNQNNLPRNYYLIEKNPILRQQQKAYLMSTLPELYPQFHWLKQLPEKFSGIILANEVLDAMPCRRFGFHNGKLYEYFVALSPQLNTNENTPFIWQTSLADETLQQQIAALEIDFPDEYISEIHPMQQNWIMQLAKQIHQGMILLFDYGYPCAEYYHPLRTQGTLNCFFQHRQHNNPLILVGIQDITTHVNFTGIAQAAHNAQLNISGYTNQSNFLLNCGITNLIKHHLDEKAKINLNQQLKILTSPNEMGELIKVMALTRGLDIDLCGFSQFDRTHTL